MAGPGLACPAGRDAADRSSRRDAADRHPGHHLAVAPGHRPPPVIAPVAPGPVRAPGNAPEGPVGGAMACPGERVVGLPPHPRRAGRARLTVAPSTVWQILKNAGIDP